jgi:hypothetical protein
MTKMSFRSGAGTKAAPVKGTVAHACHPSYLWEMWVGGPQLRPALGKNARPSLKNN